MTCTRLVAAIFKSGKVSATFFSLFLSWVFLACNLHKSDSSIQVRIVKYFSKIQLVLFVRWFYKRLNYLQYEIDLARDEVEFFCSEGFYSNDHSAELQLCVKGHT